MTTALSRSTLPGLTYSLNPYLGCGHGCRYCYCADTLRRRDLHERWGEMVIPKRDIVEALRKEIGEKPRGTVGVSTVTDPYQPLEKELELTRRCLEILLEAGFLVSIQTKSDLALRDLDLVERGKLDLGVTIVTTNPQVSRMLEPKAPPPDARVQVLEEFSARGVETWLFLGPVIPLINDDLESLRGVLEVAKRTGSLVIFDWFRPKPLAVQRLLSTLRLEGWETEKIEKSFRNPEWRNSTLSRVRSLSFQLGVRLQCAF